MRPPLVLQLSLRVGFALMALPVTVLGHGLMDAPPQRPAEEMIEHYAGRTLQAANELADLAHAEGDQRSRLRSPLLCDVTALSFTRRAARKPKASMASVMCRGALHGSLRHSVGGRDPQEGDDEDADNSFGRRGFGPRWADVAPAQARCGGTPVAGGGSGDPLAGAGRHRRDSDGMAGHLCGGR